MVELLQSLDWAQVINVLWTVVLLPILTYAWKEIHEWAKEKKVDKYTEILKENAEIVVKDLYETVVKEIKGTEAWTDEKKAEIKELAKTKLVNSIKYSAYQCLKQAGIDIESYMDSIIESSNFDMKRLFFNE